MITDNCENALSEPVRLPIHVVPPHKHHHAVQFYEEDEALLQHLCGFVCSALKTASPCLVVATASHQRGLEDRLCGLGVDIAEAKKNGQLAFFDAAETLKLFLIDGWPDSRRFEETMGGMMTRLMMRAEQANCRPEIFGEMVALLLAEGKTKAAVRLEQLWNELGQRYSFSLLCGYPIKGFGNKEDEELFHTICAEHSHVNPCESYGNLAAESQKLLTVAQLQQKAQMLQVVAAEREHLMAALSKEIADLKLTQAALVQSEKLAAAGRLAATVAHEINNPLEAVTNFIYLAKSADGLPDEVVRLLDMADEELVRVGAIARQTLGFYRDPSNSQYINIATAIEEVICVYERKLQHKQLTIDGQRDEDLTIFSRKGDLKQVVSNLLANAIDATPAHGRILVRARASHDWQNNRPGVRITVADNGEGMSGETLAKMFSAFFTTKTDVGTGIGLWVTKNILDKQSGSIRCRSSQNERRGTVMRVFLPSNMPIEREPGE